MEVLDIAAQADRDFDIHGGFKAHWRSHVWEGISDTIQGLKSDYELPGSSEEIDGRFYTAL